MAWNEVGTKTLTITVVDEGPSPPTPQPQPPEQKPSSGLLLLGAAIGLALLSKSGEKR